MLTAAPTFRQALRMQKPATWRLAIGKLWPLPDACAWEAREEMLDKMAADLGDHGPWPQIGFLMHLQEIAGRDWQRLLEELQARWSRAATASSEGGR